MNLPKRLLACAAYVRPGRTVTDVGTDHALLPCWLAKNNHAVVAADVNEKPLQRAAETIAREGMEEQVRLCLSDGLEQILPEWAEDIIIAGMGGELIFRIIEACPWTKEPQRRLILQPMTQADTLRTALCAAGYEIQDETALVENGRQYTVLCVHFQNCVRQLSEREALGGKHLEKADEASAAYLSHQRQKLVRIANGLSQSASGAEEAESLRALAETLYYK